MKKVLSVMFLLAVLSSCGSFENEDLTPKPKKEEVQTDASTRPDDKGGRDSG